MEHEQERSEQEHVETLKLVGRSCAHLAGLIAVRAAEQRSCVECEKIGSWWVHLRTCQACGATHCCDSSPNRHATRHFLESGHPVVASAEPGERWLFCYAHDVFVQY